MAAFRGMNAADAVRVGKAENARRELRENVDGLTRRMEESKAKIEKLERGM